MVVNEDIPETERYFYNDVSEGGVKGKFYWGGENIYEVKSLHGKPDPEGMGFDISYLVNSEKVFFKSFKDLQYDKRATTKDVIKFLINSGFIKERE